MAMIGMIGGMTAILAQVFGIGDCSVDLETTLAILFGGIFGGKAWQKQAEKQATD